MRHLLLVLIVLCLVLLPAGPGAAQLPSAEESPADEASEPGAEEPTRYDASAESLAEHPVPEWFEDAKFGIFVHWGPYSVPAYAPAPDGVPVGGFPFTFNFQYSEWYWNHMSQPGTPQYQHHLEQYGADFNYDDFIRQWKAEAFDAEAMVDLFNDAGAQYFVQVSKHHDGFALFPSETTNRHAGAMGPGRDLVGELFQAARKDGNLHAGLYYSVYEWYHPAYKGINDTGATLFNGPATPPYNPYTGQEIPYYGYLPVDSYVDDHQVPQMREIMERYRPDVLWCDGAWDNSQEYWHANELIAEYYNRALAVSPDGVVVNNRCGNGAHADFSTPEYTSENAINPDKWEATRGIGFSFGYNQFEDELQYLSSDEIIDSLVDIVSKNGNFLLNIGPKADGSVIELMQERLRDVGAWLSLNGEAIYGTHYWETFGEDSGAGESAEAPVPTVGDGDSTNVGTPSTTQQGLRFTVADKGDADAFYITALDYPDGEQLRVDSPVPIEEGDEVRLLGWPEPLEWSRAQGGPLLVTLPEGGEFATGLQHAFTFRIAEPEYVAPDVRPRPSPQVGTVEDKVVRHGGAGRTATAAAASGATATAAETVVLARADDYADALTGGPLATFLEAPLLLTGSDGLDEAAAGRIAQLGAREAVLLGGSAALGPQVDADLRDLGLDVRRVAGENRFATAAAVMAALPETDEVFLAEGAHPDSTRGWPDALSASGLAALEEKPVLLVTSGSLPPETAERLNGVTATLVGGRAAIGDAVEKEVRERADVVTRLAGADRYATSTRVADEATARGLQVDEVWLATGRDWPDGLVAGAAAGATDAALLLVDGRDLDASPASRDWLEARAADLRLVHLVGGLAAISDAVEARLVALLSQR